METVKRLIDKGADINVRDNKGVSLFDKTTDAGLELELLPC